MVLYFSGTGNSEYVAKRIGHELKDDVINLFERLRDGDVSGLESKRPWIVVSPTYAWRIPYILQSWLEKVPLLGRREIYFVMTCGDSIGNAGKYLAMLCKRKRLVYQGCWQVIMPENYIALFTTPGEEEAYSIIRKAEVQIEEALNRITKEEPLLARPISILDRINSSLVNRMFYPFCVHTKKFYSTEACVGCGLCVAVCPKRNIRLDEQRPRWGSNCTHCMACINRCPKKAIEYGKHSRGQVRYIFPKSYSLLDKQEEA